MLNKTIIALTTAVALGCVPVATNASAAVHSGGHGSGHATSGHAMGGHAMGGHAMARHARGGHGARYGGYYGGDGYYGGGGPIYDSCGPDYGCPGYGLPVIGGVINGIFGGYDSY